jgi:head-tail adaptor
MAIGITPYYCEAMTGQFRYKLQVQQNQATPDGTGGFTTNWVNVGNPLFCNCEVKESSRFYLEGMEYIGVTYLLRLRYKSFMESYTGPSEEYRFILDPSGLNKTLKIITLANPDLLQRFIELTCIDNG